ncbi:MAG: CTP synthetase [Candidatus Aenigmarchaeota archaeon ex4484_14]|nr:MAG: CTP synthetase [Candidatus Aenigmarchaeota archaeon ex4484_14]
MKIIFTFGGVISGVGKGVVSSSIGKILKEYGFSVTMIKIDPYINSDAGTMRPTEHGEVWVTNDGGEIDQDLGNYERFLNKDMPKINNITSGQVYSQIIEEERSGEFLGETVQFIPHVPEEIVNRIKAAGKGYDFVVVEVGGTVGDYENIPFLFAAKRLEVELNKDNIVYVLVTYLPIPSNLGEMKTKPTQHAIMMLREYGLFPDFIIGRSSREMDKVRKKKIETYSNISCDYILSCPDVDNIYKVPLVLEKQGFGSKLMKLTKTRAKKNIDWSAWEKIIEKMNKPKNRVKIAIVGKYIDIGDFTLKDSYISVQEALKHAGAYLDTGVDIDWIDSKKLEQTDQLTILKNYDGIIVPGGFGSSGVEGKINAIRVCRENKIPYLGLCFGMQLAIIEIARNICNLEGAHTTEICPETKYPVIDILPSQKEIIKKSAYGGTMRLGAYAAILDPNSKIFEFYKKTGRLEEDVKKINTLPEKRLGIVDNEKNIIFERHRHRYEVNPEFVDILKKHGVTQGHPEFKSRPESPSPMFVALVDAALKRH